MHRPQRHSPKKAALSLCSMLQPRLVAATNKRGTDTHTGPAGIWDLTCSLACQAARYRAGFCTGHVQMSGSQHSLVLQAQLTHSDSTGIVLTGSPLPGSLSSRHQCASDRLAVSSRSGHSSPHPLAENVVESLPNWLQSCVGRLAPVCSGAALHSRPRPSLGAELAPRWEDQSIVLVAPQSPQQEYQVCPQLSPNATRLD